MRRGRAPRRRARCAARAVRSRRPARPAGGAGRGGGRAAGARRPPSRTAGARGAPDSGLQLVEHALRLAPAEPAALAPLWGSRAPTSRSPPATPSARTGCCVTRSSSRSPPSGHRCSFASRCSPRTTAASARPATSVSRRCARLATSPGARVVVQRRLALAHLLRAELADAERHAASAAKLAATSEPRESAARALANLACIQAIRGRWTDASPSIERALALEGAPGVASIDDSPSAVAGLLLMYRGELQEAPARGSNTRSRKPRPPAATRSAPVCCSRSASSRAAPGTSTRRASLAIRGLTASEQTDQRTERTVLLYAQGARRGAPRHGRRRSRRRGGGPGRRRARGAPLRRGAEPLGARAPRALRRAGGCGPGPRSSRRSPCCARAASASRAFSPSTRRRSTRCSCSATSTARACWWRSSTRLRAGRGCAPPRLAPGGCCWRPRATRTAALRELADALEQHRALGMPFALARTELALGSAQRRAKQRAVARSSLTARRGGVRGARRDAVGRARPRRGGAGRRPPAGRRRRPDRDRARCGRARRGGAVQPRDRRGAVRLRAHG